MTSQNLSTSIDAPAVLPKAWIERLFERMAFTYGKKFSDQWGGVEVEGMKRFWAEKLAGYSGAELKRGVDALDTREWPPSLPEFLKLCRPAIDPVIAYYEALNGSQARSKGQVGTWTSPAIFWAYSAIGAFDFNNVPFTQLKPRWERALGEQVAKGEWPEIPEPNIALPAPGQAYTTREEAAKRLLEIGASTVIKRPEVGGKEWAHRTLARTDVPPIAHEFAREALGMKQ